MTTMLHHSGPLAATLARLNNPAGHLAVEYGPEEDGWFRAEALFDPDGALLADGLERQIKPYPTAEKRVAAAFFIGRYVWYVLGAAVAGFLAERRVPDLAPASLALRYRTVTWQVGEASGEYDRVDVRWLGERFAALPDDPAAADPAATILPDERALREWLRVGAEAHLAPLIDALSVRTRLGKRAQWNLVADALANLFQRFGQHLGDEAGGCAHGLASIQAAGSPLRGSRTTYLTIDHAGRSQTFLQRGGCCLYYRVDAEQRCATCPLRPSEERERLLRESMAGAAH